MSYVLEKISEVGIVPVVAIDQVEDARKLARALLDGGVNCAEITFRTPVAEECLKIIANEFPDILLGAGTVLSQDQAKRAVAAGARFIVSPGFDAKVVDWCIQNDVEVTPGIATPTEINMALNMGLSVVKFFPAEILGGTKMLKAIAAPYGNVKFIPTGGIYEGNLAEYLVLPMVIACGGSWLVKRDVIAKGQFELITSYAKDAIKIVNDTRGAKHHEE